MTSDSFNRLSLTWEHQPWGRWTDEAGFWGLVLDGAHKAAFADLSGLRTSCICVSNKGFVVFLLQKANQSLSFDSPQARHSLKPLSFPCYLFMMGPVLKEVIQKLWLGEQVALKKPLNSQIMEKHVFWIGKCPWFPERGLWAWHSVRGGGLLCHLQIFI